MIVLNNNKESTPIVDRKNTKQELSLEELFCRELDAYCSYKEWAEETEDAILEMALEEIMLDEYLHAKFLRDYLIDNNSYTLKPEDPYEMKFWKVQKHVFED